MSDTLCRGCTATVRLKAGEVERILADYLKANPGAALADDAQYSARLAACSGCSDFQYGTTCRHCGCLVAVRAKLLDKACPMSRWAD